MIKSILGGKSKNLFDISKADVVIHSDMSFSSNVSYNSHFYSIPVEAGQTYTVSYDIYAIEGGGTQIALSCQTGDFYQDGVLLFLQLTPDNSINNWKHITNTFTIPSGATKITFSSLKYPEYPKYFRNFQLELGSTATEYVPHELTSYKSIMKVSDVCQLVDPKYIHTIVDRGVTFTNNGDGSITVNGTPTGTYYSVGTIALDTKSIKSGHKYIIYSIDYQPVISQIILANYQGGYFFRGETNIFTFPEHHYTRFVFEIRVNLNQTANNIVVIPQLFDITEMFGAGNEPKTVAEFKAKFPNDYYPYSPSCFVTSFDERMPCKTKNLLNIIPSMCNRCTYKDGILKANVVDFYYAWLRVTDLFEIGNTYTVSWSIIHKKSLRQTAAVVVYGKSKTDPDKTVYHEYRSGITDNKYTFTINDEDFSSISFVELRFFRYSTTTTDTESSILNVQVELGTTATDYVPYGYV